MKLNKRIIAFTELGKILKDVRNSSTRSGLNLAIENASKANKWFSKENIFQSIESLGEILEKEKINQWISGYDHIDKENKHPKKIGVIMAGNIPLVGFHDFLCVLMSDHCISAKLSSGDLHLLPAVAKILIELEPGFKERILFIPTFNISNSKSKDNDSIAAFIATGSNNSAQHFDYYFRKYPHIIRRNRSSVGILSGTESENDLKMLGNDIFQYFGMGCRNVSKIYIPEGYNLDKVFSSIVDFGDVIHHHKYANNYNYYRSIYLLNTEKFLDNNFIMLKESAGMASPVGTLYYEQYKNETDLYNILNALSEQIQCISSNRSLPPSLEPIRVDFGKTQQPALWDYADGVDTMNFLLTLK